MIKRLKMYRQVGSKGTINNIFHIEIFFFRLKKSRKHLAYKSKLVSFCVFLIVHSFVPQSLNYCITCHISLSSLYTHHP